MLAFGILSRVTIHVFSTQGNLAQRHLGTFLTGVWGWAMEGVIASLHWGGWGLQLWGILWFPSSLCFPPFSFCIRAALLVDIPSPLLWVSVSPLCGTLQALPQPSHLTVPFLALPWAVLSPWSSSSFFISCVFLPLPCRKMDVSIILRVCKGIYANLNISVGNTLFIPRLHSKPLAILPRMHPSSAQYHQYSLEIPHRPQTRFSFACSSWSLVIGLLRWMVLLLLWDQRECCWSSMEVSSLWPLKSLGCLGFRYPSLGQEWGATSHTLFTWHCVFSSFQNRQNTCSVPRAWVWVCTHVQHLHST